MSAALDGEGLGLRARIALALVAVLALASAIALLALRPLAGASQRSVRRHASVALSRSVAGQVQLTARDRWSSLLADSLGVGALEGAAVLDAQGGVVVATGSRANDHGPLPTDDRVVEHGERITVTVSLPSGGALVTDASLAPGRAERSLSLAMMLYTALASLASMTVVYAVLTRTIVRPMELLTQTAERVAEGKRELPALPSSRGAPEIVRASHAFHTMTTLLIARERDLSERVNALEAATRELRAAQNQLVRSERLATVGRLAAGIAHEVGNSLAAIVGLADVVREGELDANETRDFGTRIGAEAQRIHRTVRELLDYARAAPGDQEGQCLVADAVAHVRRLLEPQKSLRSVAWTTQIEADCTVPLPLDRLVQVILNLVLNAVDACEGQAECALTLRAATIGQGATRVEVEDNGPGIPQELRQKVFEPFYTTRPAGKATGLGLAICTAIVEQGRGTLVVQSREDGAQGTCMRMDFTRASLPVSSTA